MNNFDTYRNIENRVNSLISQAINNLPKSLPCKVESVEKNVIKAIRLLKNNNIIGFVESVPIVRTIYNGYPIKRGDLGLLLALDYPVMSYVENADLIQTEMRLNSNGAGYVFLPLVNNKDLVENVEAFEFHSLNNKRVVVIDDDKIELSNEKHTIIIDDDKIELFREEKYTITIDEEKIELKNDKANILITTDKIELSNDNTVVLNDSGIKIEDKNGNVIELGSSSVKINNNLEVKQ